jgi:hypothetical protein
MLSFSAPCRRTSASAAKTIWRSFKLSGARGLLLREVSYTVVAFAADQGNGFCV